MRATLKIVDRNWTGWSPEQPAPSEFAFVVSTGDVLHDRLPDSDFYRVQMVVHQIANDFVVLKTCSLAPEQPGGGIDLMSNFSGLRTRLARGCGITLRTQTMDGGKSYTITLVDISE